MTLKTDKIKNALLKKGFKIQESDHHFFSFYCNGEKTTIRTKISHGEKEIDDSLINKMQKQLHLTKQEFLDLINCPLSEDEYKKLMFQRNVI